MTTKIIIKNQDGAAIVEFALIVPLLLLLIFGMIEFSLLLFNKHVITNSSREGARAGVVAREDRFVLDPTTTPPSLGDDINVVGTVNNWIADHLVTFGGSGVPTVVINIVNDDPSIPGPEPCDSSTTFYTFGNFYSFGGVVPCLDHRCCLKVIVSYDYHFLFLSAFGFGPINLVAETVMLME